MMRAIELTPEHPIDRVTDLGIQAEREGFETVFVSHHYNNRDSTIALADLARATESVALGPGIANPYETHPVALASRVATLDEHSDGRAVFGVGPGDRSTLSNLGVDQDDALRRTLETMTVARKLWAGDRVSQEGTFVADDAGLNYSARPLPVYVGAQGPHMLRMSAKHADGALFNGSHPRDLTWAREQVDAGLADRREPADESGDPSAPLVDAAGFELAAYASVSVAEDPAAAREAARPPVAFIAAGAADPVLARHDLDTERAAAIGDAIAAGAFSEAFGAVSEAMIDAFAVAGTVEDVAERFDALLASADGLVVGSPLGPDLDRAIELAAAALRRATA
jgi:5,10-methylenetetrahydromethanopterin reductase